MFLINCNQGFFSDTVLGNKGIKMNPTKGPQESSSPPSNKSLLEQPTSDVQIPIDELQMMSHNKNTFFPPKTTGLILKAVNDVENQFWNYSLIEREDSVIMISLYYLQKLLRF